MADFSTAFDITSAHEGGYANDSLDRGGETYRGISRVHHPAWPGWKRVDAQRAKAGFPKSLDRDEALQAGVRAFYKAAYWDPVLGDQLPDQAVANELYDTAVNMGVRRAVRFLQVALNLLNRNRQDYDDLIVDGWLGDKSFAALQVLLKKDRSSAALVKLMNIQQGAHYAEIMVGDPSQERFARGWLQRV